MASNHIEPKKERPYLRKTLVNLEEEMEHYERWLKEQNHEESIEEERVIIIDMI
jgi:hypothetical protein